MNWIKEIFSENGVMSSKRVFGGFIILCCMTAILVMVFKEGCSKEVESLLELSEMLGAGLLGLSTVTSIWKNDSNTTSADTKKEENKNV